jgi:tetratricopeptide (TPR) repeat protein
MALLGQNRNSEAEAEARKALASLPQSGVIYYILGTTLLKQGQLSESIAALERSITLTPNLISSYINLGSACRAAGHIAKAIRYAQHAIEFNPNDAISYDNLGNCYVVVGDFDAAKRCFETVLRIDANNIPARYSLALLHKRMGDFDAALAVTAEVIARAPDLADGYGLKAAILENQNRLDEAEAFLTDALRRFPGHPRLLIAAGTLDFRRKRYKGAIAEFNTMLAQPGDSNASDIAVAHNLLGLAYEAAGDFERAYEAFENSNEWQQKTTEARQFDKTRFLKRIDEISQAFDRAPPALWCGDGAADLFSPVFLVGFPRSGTSLLAQILDAHPDIAVLQEEQVSPHLLFELSKLDPSNPMFPAVAKEQRRKLQEAYLERCKKLGVKTTGKVIVDKQPLNLVHAAQLLLVFPSAKFVFNVRHPMDAVLSCFKQNFLPNDSMANCYSLGDAATLYGTALGAWTKFNEKLDIRNFSVRYEALTASPLEVTGALAEFLSVSWSPEILADFGRQTSNLKILTPSFRQVYDGIHNGSVGRWRRYENKFSMVSGRLAPWVARFGYDGI